jgi:hypothetical protein
MKQYIVSDGKNKGIIVKAENVSEARETATRLFYSPYMPLNDLCVIQPFKENNMFSNDTFKELQFHTFGGVTTKYNVSINEQPSEQQLNFLGKPIEYIIFTNFNSVHERSKGETKK